MVLFLQIIFSQEFDNMPFSKDDQVLKSSGLTEEQLGIIIKGTGLDGIESAVYKAEQDYGINAMYIVAHACLETGWGKSGMEMDGELSVINNDNIQEEEEHGWWWSLLRGSWDGLNGFDSMWQCGQKDSLGKLEIAQRKGNLFGWSAFDNSPYSSARTFVEDGDTSIAQAWCRCIDFVMGRVKALYLTVPSNPKIKGVGDYYMDGTLTGMNKNYASDPLWAVKIEQIANKLLKKID